MLVNAKDMVNKAFANKYAVPHFNINNLEVARAILMAVEELKSPVIIGVSPSAVKYMGGFNSVFGLISGIIKDQNITVPVALHLDHGKTLEQVQGALEAGWTSVMYDGSRLPINENIELSKKAADMAQKYNASFEGEVGTIGQDSAGIKESINYGSLEEIQRFVKEVKTDMLSAAVGSVHGAYKGEPKLLFDKINEFATVVKVPLVLHGGSGIPDAMIQEAIKNGEAKINVNTELQIAGTNGIIDWINNHMKQDDTGFDPRKLNSIAIKNMVAAAKEKILLFGSNNKA